MSDTATVEKKYTVKDSDRLTVPEARKVCEQYDLQMITGAYVEGFAACAVGTLAVRSVGPEDAEELGYDPKFLDIENVTGVPHLYIMGLESGFEEFNVDEDYYDANELNDPDFKLGLRDGRRIRKAVQKGNIPGNVEEF